MQFVMGSLAMKATERNPGTCLGASATQAAEQGGLVVKMRSANNSNTVVHQNNAF
jgi:hypothetical protein